MNLLLLLSELNEVINILSFLPPLPIYFEMSYALLILLKIRAVGGQAGETNPGFISAEEYGFVKRSLSSWVRVGGRNTTASEQHLTKHDHI